jgi:DNA repair exonuclease SbcCD ATPase subunit
MKINSIKIQNFYSFESVEVDFSKFKKITLIKGHNKDALGSNGAGKSAFIEAIFFGLTGKTIRKSTEDAMVNVKHKKKCLVELHLDQGITISRQKKPSKLQLFINKKEETKESIAKTQEYIDEILNINYKVLLSSMFFGQGNTTTFLECSAEDKRNIVKTFLDLDDIFVMRDRIKKHKAGFYQTMKEQDSLISEHTSMISEFTSKIEKINKAKNQFSQYDEAILAMSLEDILEQEEFETTRAWQEVGLSRDLQKVTDQIDKIKVLLESHLQKDGPGGICDRCGQAIKRTVNKEFLEEELVILNKEKLILNNSLDGIEDQKQDLLITSKEFSKVLAYKELCRDETNYESLIKSYKEKIQLRSEVKAKNKLDYEVMRFWEKAFSQQGIIKFIIKNILDYLNNKVNYYLSFLTNSKYSLLFDEELNEKVVTHGSDIQYISLSGGEKRKINLAVTMALKDLLLLTDINQSNILFLDEIAENLDEEGIQGLYNLLQEIKKDKLIFIITHNKYLKTLLHSAPRLSIIKSNGVSTIKK